MMKNLKLDRPIVFIDAETTGTHPHSDRIVELSVFRVQPDGSEEYRSHRVNPEVPIPAETTVVHGIADKDVAEEPTFRRMRRASANSSTVTTSPDSMSQPSTCLSSKRS